MTTSSTTTVTYDDLLGMAGTDLGYSSWVDVDQARIDAFAHATDDHQWIHTDPERAKDGPFGATIGHGYLTLSLIIPMWTELLDVEGVRTKVNYGLNRLRFPAPVPSGSRIRLNAVLTEIEAIAGDGVQFLVDAVIEIEGGSKPAAVAQLVFRFYR